MSIKIIDGDLFTTNAKIICHQVNCQGEMNTGVAQQVREKFPHVYEEYKGYVEAFREVVERSTGGYFKLKLDDLLGVVYATPIKKQNCFFYVDDCFNQKFVGYKMVESNQYIANLFAQANYGYDGKMYTDLQALKGCFTAIRDVIQSENVLTQENVLHNATIAMPYKIGCCRGGADWEKEVFPMIQEVFKDCDVELWRWDRG